MLYLARGIYALMNGKEKPKMSSFVSGGSNTESEDEDGNDFPYYIMIGLLIAWGIYSYRMGNKVGTSIGVASLMANPFIVVESSSSSGGSSRWGGGSSSSSSGGGFGGGSWGGGGSGGRW